MKGDLNSFKQAELPRLHCLYKCKKLLRILRGADPYVNDATFALSMVFLEELGATGNKVSC